MRIRWMAMLLALVFTLGVFALPALADGDKAPDEEFSDMGEAEWALGAVAAMNVKGVIKGDGAGHFRPGDAINHQEAVALAIRILGKEAEARHLSLLDLNLGIADFTGVAAWAQADVALAANLGILPPLDGGNFQPTVPATRLWTAIMLVKALGYEAEAQANMNASLDFADAASIPASASGYVYASANHGLFRGITGADGKLYFMADGPVTRAQIAVLLHRSDDQLPYTPERALQARIEVKGRITATDAASGTVTVDHHGVVTTYTLAANASVFVDEKLAALAQAQAAMEVKLFLNAQGEVRLLQARPDDGDDEERHAVEGRFLAATATAVSLLVHGEARTIDLAAEYVVMIKGQTATLAAISVGANLNVKLDATGKAVLLDANNPHRDDDRDREHPERVRGGGTISAITLTSPPSLEITARTGAKATYTLAVDAELEAGDRSIVAADLHVGDMVEYKLEGSTIVELRVLRPGR